MCPSRWLGLSKVLSLAGGTAPSLGNQCPGLPEAYALLVIRSLHFHFLAREGGVDAGPPAGEDQLCHALVDVRLRSRLRQPTNEFISDQTLVRAEERLALTCLRPQAVVKITGLN
jgi:hypothetical protein